MDLLYMGSDVPLHMSEGQKPAFRESLLSLRLVFEARSLIVSAHALCSAELPLNPLRARTTGKEPPRLRLYMGSREEAQVIKFVWQMLLPAEPSF